jgi:hypothetical protein
VRPDWLPARHPPRATHALHSPSVISNCEIANALVAGDKQFVDWAGHKVPIIDQLSGKVH